MGDNQGKMPLLFIDLMSLGRQGETPITFLSVFVVAADGRADQVCTEDNSMIDLLAEICPYAISNLPSALGLLGIADWTVYDAVSFLVSYARKLKAKNKIYLWRREGWGSG